MSKRVLAITTCRVSTPEQLDSNSLDRQRDAVIQAAQHLGAIVPEDGQWSGSVSSKAGTNIERKDLKEMLVYCRRNPLVKFLIVHEIDRFMRSVRELFYWEVEFEKLGVKVWYASQPELNTGDHHAKLLKALEAFKGEGSNVERQKKSIDGNTNALSNGKWPFSPKPGYMRGHESGVKEVHPVRGPILKKILIRIVEGRLTPSQGLVELNKSEFMNERCHYKMDKFRKIITDPFYAGILHVDKQIKVHNENGLHEPLISKRQHYELVNIMDAKKKTQSGPQKNGNPKYPLNNIVSCDLCKDKKYGRIVGVDIHNGKNKERIYEKYRCRECLRSLSRQDLHSKVRKHFESNPMSKDGLDDLMQALEIVWRRREGEVEQEISRIRAKITLFENSIRQQVEAVTDHANISIREYILDAISKKKDEISSLEDEMDKLEHEKDNNKVQFMKFAFGFVEDMGNNFLEISQEDRVRCKQILFPSGFCLDRNKNVYTPDISPLYRLATMKKDTEVSENSLLVRMRRL